MASAEKALIEQCDNELDAEHENVTRELKDTKFSWFVCACTFLTQVFVLGLLHAFGVFFVEFVHEFSTSKGETAWIGSLAYGLSMAFGPVTSFLVKRFGYRVVMMTGGFLCACSVVTSSFATSLVHLFVTFSLLYGMGTSMSTGPTMTITPEYFEKYLTVAVGITVSGSSFGTLIMGPLSQVLCDSIGWRNVFRIYSGLLLLTVICNSRIKPLNNTIVTNSVESLRKAPGSRLIADLKLWKNRVFVIWTIAITLVMFGFYIPYVHLVSYAMDMGISQDKASILIMILGACTATGRLVFGKIINTGVLNRLHMHQLSMVVTGTGVLLLPLIKSFTGIIMYVITVGLVDGCFVVLLPILTTSLVGIENSVLAWGFLVGSCSITFTLGPPVAGLLYDMTGTYNIAFHCAGVPIIAGAVILFLIPWAQKTASSTNVMKIVNEFSVGEYTQQPSPASSLYEDGSTIRLRTININRIGISVRDFGTSTTDVEFVDKSTSTISIPTPTSRLPMDVEDALKQLRHNDKVFTAMLKNAQNPSDSPATVGPSHPMVINRVPSSVRSPARSRDDEMMNGSKLSSKHSSQLEASLSPEFLPQFGSNTIQPLVDSSGVFLPSASQLYTLGVPVSASASASGAISNISSVSHCQQDREPSQQSSAFDQVISDQVEQLIERLKSPTPEQQAFPSTMSSCPQTGRSKVKSPSDSIGDTILHLSQALPAVQVTGPSPDLSSRDGPSTSGSTSGNASPVKQESSVSKLWMESTAQDAVNSVFDKENQLTVLPGTNPFVTKPADNVATDAAQRLQDLFTVNLSGEEDAIKTSSFEVLSINSQDNVVPSSTHTSEIDVFTHLFTDDE